MLKVSIFISTFVFSGCITNMKKTDSSHSRKMALALKKVRKCDFKRAKKIIGSIPEQTLRFEYRHPVQKYGGGADFRSYPKKAMFEYLDTIEKAVTTGVAGCEKIKNKESESGFASYKACMEETSANLDVPHEDYVKGKWSEYEQEQDKKSSEIKPNNLPFCDPATFIPVCFVPYYEKVMTVYETKLKNKRVAKMNNHYADNSASGICEYNHQIRRFKKQKKQSRNLLEKQLSSAGGGRYDKNKIEQQLLKSDMTFEAQIEKISQARKSFIKIYTEHSGKRWSNSNCEDSE